MTPYYEDEQVRLFAGDCLDVLRELADNSVDTGCAVCGNNGCPDCHEPDGYETWGPDDRLPIGTNRPC